MKNKEKKYKLNINKKFKENKKTNSLKTIKPNLFHYVLKPNK